MNLFKLNMESLKIHRPHIHKNISNIKETRYELHEKNNHINLFDKIKGVFVYPNDPMKEITSEFSNMQINNLQLAIFLGFGIGYQIKAFQENLVKKYGTKHIIIIEKDIELFFHALNILDLTSLISNKKVYFIFGNDTKKIRNNIRRLFLKSELAYYIKSMNFIFYSKIFNLHKEYYLNIAKTIKKTLMHVVHSVGNDPYDSILGLENVLKNIDIIIDNPGIKEFKDKFKNKPAVIVSTGPSLNKNKHHLHKIKDKAVIICPDASLKILLDMGIKPNIVVALERTMGIDKFFKNLNYEDVKDTYFVACPVIKREVYDLYPGPKIIVYRDFDHFRWLGIEKGILEIKSSSGNMAFKIATYLGCNPVTLIGQDLALAENGNTHADGMVLGEKVNGHYDRGLLKVPGNYQKEVVTSNIMYPFIQEYNIDVTEFEGLCINSTEGGAYIEGTKLMPFIEAIDNYILSSAKNNKIGHDFHKLFHDYEENSKKTIYINLRKHLKKSHKSLEEIKLKYVEFLDWFLKEKKTINDFLNSNDTSKTIDISRIFNTINSNRQSIISNHSQIYQRLLGHNIQSYFISFMMNQNAIFGNINRTVEDELNWVLKYEEYYKVIHKIVEMTDSLISESMKHIDLLLDGGTNENKKQENW